jgi:galactose mutarotase-like enzyme
MARDDGYSKVGLSAGAGLSPSGMLVELECGHLRATVSPLGAELRSLSLRGVEYLWPAQDPWKRTAPLLFPIVGRLNDDTLFHNDRRYTMAQHGFARDKSFQIEHVSQSAATFRLLSDQSTRLQYPFEFVLEVTYALSSDAFVGAYVIDNPGTEVLPVSFGVHPAFRWPLKASSDKTAYSLRFEGEEGPTIRRLNSGLLKPELFPSPVRDRVLSLSESLFENDAVILLGVNSTELQYTAPEVPEVRLSWTGFPDLGVWSKSPGDFVCIEPWHGHADPVGFTDEFTHKPGLMLIEAGGTREFTLRIEPRA